MFSGVYICMHVCLYVHPILHTMYMHYMDVHVQCVAHMNGNYHCFVMYVLYYTIYLNNGTACAQILLLYVFY